MKSNIRKSLGFIALAVTVACWIGAPILPFLEIPDKVLYTTVVVITGELFFVVTVALLGKEYWQKIKQRVNEIFLKKQVEE